MPYANTTNKNTKVKQAQKIHFLQKFQKDTLALFELAKESDELEDTVNQSKTLIQIYEKDFNFKKFISDPTITIENQKKILVKFQLLISQKF